MVAVKTHPYNGVGLFHAFIIYNQSPNDYYANKRLIGLWKNIAVAKRELSKLDILVSDIFSKIVNGENVEWKCHLTCDGKYSVHSLRHKIDQITTTSMTKIDWIKEVPYKVLCFV